MPFQYEGWTLYSRELKVRPGIETKVYFFSKKQPESGEPVDELPNDRAVAVNMRTGLPFLRSK